MYAAVVVAVVCGAIVLFCLAFAAAGVIDDVQEGRKVKRTEYENRLIANARFSTGSEFKLFDLQEKLDDIQNTLRQHADVLNHHLDVVNHNADTLESLVSDNDEYDGEKIWTLEQLTEKVVELEKKLKDSEPPF